jgi:hypothetical protein
MSAVFENRDSVLLQIQEMVRTERITAEAAIQHEIDDLQRDGPRAARQLSVTMFVEIPEKERCATALLTDLGPGSRIALALDVRRAAASRPGADRDRRAGPRSGRRRCITSR